MAGTPFCVLPVTKLNNTDIGDGKVGPIYKKLLKTWGDVNKVDVEKQIKNWNKKMDNTVTIGPYKFK